MSHASSSPRGRPIASAKYDAFSYPCLDQLIDHVGRYRWRSGGALSLPRTVRLPYGGVRAPELHEDSREACYAHTPGVKVVVPAIRDPDPGTT